MEVTVGLREIAILLLAETELAALSRAGMEAENTYRANVGTQIAYREEAFDALERKLAAKIGEFRAACGEG